MKHLIQVTSASGWNVVQTIDVTLLSLAGKQAVLEIVKADSQIKQHAFTAQAMTRKGNTIGHGWTSKDKTAEW